MTKKTALIAGATGLTGSALLKLLLESDKYHKIKVLSRKPVKHQHPKIEQLLIDFDKLSDYTNFLKADDVYCCLGTTIKKVKTKKAFKKVDYYYPLELAKLTKAEGVKNFVVVSSVGANEKSLFFYTKVKGALEKALKALGYKRLHIFRPSLLLGKREDFRFGEYMGSLIFKMMKPFFIGPFKKYRGIRAEFVAQAMYYAAQDNATGIFEYHSHDIWNICQNAKKA